VGMSTYRVRVTGHTDSLTSATRGYDASVSSAHTSSGADAPRYSVPMCHVIYARDNTLAHARTYERTARRRRDDARQTADSGR
jgi:hypothetical protein